MIDLLREHHETLTKLLQSQSDIQTDELQIGLRITWKIYVNILEDAITTLDSIIEYLSK